MLIQVVLIAVVIGFIVWAARQRPTAISALKKMGILLLGLIMILSILVPEMTTHVANWMGVGRGADLLLYGVTATFVVYALTQYTRNQANRRLIFSLARRVALIEAQNRYSSRLDQGEMLKVETKPDE